MIDRKAVLKRNNPKLDIIVPNSPLTVGNGVFAYTADITGMQSLQGEYEKFPLCTMSEWGWHITPVSEDKYTYTENDLQMTEYDFNGRKVKYAVEEKAGNEKVYKWLRENPHKYNLGNIGLIYNNKPILAQNIKNINQELDLYTGILNSDFMYNGTNCSLKTFAMTETDGVGFEVTSSLLQNAELAFRLKFPYPSPNKAGSDYSDEKKKSHKSIIYAQNADEIIIKRIMDKHSYFVKVAANTAFDCKNHSEHEFDILPQYNAEQFYFEVEFAEKLEDFKDSQYNSKVRCMDTWKDFWNKSGIVDFSGSTVLEALELERRIILSLYLLKAQESGNVPPQETGLSCNSWYGKAHLEMHLLHSAQFPLWNNVEALKSNLLWYKKHEDIARKNAEKNGFKGIRWPKMIDKDGNESPSQIATLLIWQQSHIIYMLELLYKIESENSNQLLEMYWSLVEGTAEFMCDFMQKDTESGKYNLLAPIIPSQEVFSGEEVKNPTFELEYWHFTLGLAISWSKRKGILKSEWIKVYNNIAPAYIYAGKYMSYEGCDNSFEMFNFDHPSQLAIFGLIPGERVDRLVIEKTLEEVCDKWNYETMWGWDFAIMAMTAIRLGKPELAMKLLLKDTYKNCYMENGNNYQLLRDDLPLYMPGNGSILLAAALAIAGYKGSEELPGIPKNGCWRIKYENINKLPF